MNWYGVRVLFRSTVSGQPEAMRLDPHYHEDDFYEECLLLIQAETPQEAADRAESRSREKERTYLNRYNQTVEFRYYDWLQVDEIRDLTLHSGSVAMTATYRMPKGADLEDIIGRQFSPCGREELFPLHNLNVGR